MLLCRSLPHRLVRRRLTINHNNILPECLKIDEELIIKKNTNNMPGTAYSFHLMAAGGFNGLLAKLYEHSGRANAMISIHEQMKKEGITKNVTACNYLIYAYLSRRNHEAAYRLVYEMEQSNITPNLMTFEVLLTGLSHIRGMGMVNEELFELMQVKYGLNPSITCWSALIRTWIFRRTYSQSIQTYDKFLNQFPNAKLCGKVHSELLKCAVGRRTWFTAAHIIKHLRTSIIEPSDLIMVPVTDLREIWSMQSLFNDSRAVPVVRFIARTIFPTGLDEGSALRLLYFAGSCESEAPDLADMAMSSLIRTYRDTGAKKANLPSNLIEAYLAAVDTVKDESLLTPLMKTRVSVFKSMIEKSKLANL